MGIGSFRLLGGALTGGVPVALVVASGSVYAQAEAAADAPAHVRTFSLTPAFSASEIYTDNATLGSGDSKHSDLISTLTPSLHLQSTTGRLTGFFDYSLNDIIYGHGTSANQLQNLLNAAASAEAIENWAYVDVKAGISQQAVSAFGPQSFDPGLNSGNRTEVATYSISPYVRGRFGDLADYSVRLTRSAVRSDDTAAGFNSTTSAGQASLSGGTGLTLLTWSLDASRTLTSYGASGETQDSQAEASLSYAVLSDLKLSVQAGHEIENYTGPLQSALIYGGGFDWRPSARTKFSANIDHHAYGDSYDLKFEHRTARTVWSVTDTRSVVTGNSSPSQTSLGTAFNVEAAQYMIQHPTASQSDATSAVLQYLIANNIDPNSTVYASFLSNSVTLQHNQSISFAWNGIRDSVTFVANRTESSLLKNASGLPDDFDSSTVIRQIGFLIDLSHKLTPDSSIGLTLQQARTTGLEGRQDTTLRSAFLNWQGQISRRVYVTFGARHAESRSITSPYYETALVGSLRLEF